MSRDSSWVAVLLTDGVIVLGRTGPAPHPGFLCLTVPGVDELCPLCRGGSVPPEATDDPDRTCFDCRGTHLVSRPQETLWLPTRRIAVVREIGQAASNAARRPSFVSDLVARVDLPARRDSA